MLCSNIETCRKRERDGSAEEVLEYKRKKKVVQGRLKALLDEPLPRRESNNLRTRYPTFEMAQQYGKSADRAIDAVANDLADNIKLKRLKKLLTGRMLRRIGDKDKKKRKKLKRK
jgi:hypothetical protein